MLRLGDERSRCLVLSREVFLPTPGGAPSQGVRFKFASVEPDSKRDLSEVDSFDKFPYYTSTQDS